MKYSRSACFCRAVRFSRFDSQDFDDGAGMTAGSSAAALFPRTLSVSSRAWAALRARSDGRLLAVKLLQRGSNRRIAFGMSFFSRSIFLSSSSGPTRTVGGGKSTFRSIGVGQAAEIAEQPIKLFLRDGIEFVVVADAAAECQAQKHGARRLHAFDGVADVEFLVDRPPFAGGHVAAAKAGGHALVDVAFGKQVAGQLLDGELVKRLIGIE